MKLIVSLILILLVNTDSYDKDEESAIQDICNEFLNEFDLEPFLFENAKVDVNNLDIKVLISDSLFQIKHFDDQRLKSFIAQYKTEDQFVLKSMISNEKLEKLKSRRFAKNRIKLIKPYRIVGKPQLLFGDRFINFKFSRILFDKNKEHGILVMEFFVDYVVYPISDIETRANHYYGLTYIQRVNNQWSIKHE